MSTTKPLCFVIGPIGKDGSPERRHSDLLLFSVIKHVLEHDEFGYHVKRADEDTDPGMIGDRAITDIINAELVVADLTDLNANAFYELGIRHSIEKPTIHIARSGTDLPFDNAAQRTIFVDLTDWHSQEAARKRIADAVRAIRDPNFRVSNPITQANASFNMRQSKDPIERVVSGLAERLSSMEAKLLHKQNRRTIQVYTRDDEGRRAYAAVFGENAMKEFFTALETRGGTFAVQTHQRHLNNVVIDLAVSGFEADESQVKFSYN